MCEKVCGFIKSHFDFRFYGVTWIIFEEGFELLFYVSLLGIVWLYSRNKNFIADET